MKVIKGYTLVNDSKVNRCYTELGAGKLATDDEVLTHYAKFGGLIKKLIPMKKDKDGAPAYEVISNSKFWDFENKKPVSVKKEVEKK